MKDMDAMVLAVMRQRLARAQAEAGCGAAFTADEEAAASGAPVPDAGTSGLFEGVTEAIVRSAGSA